MTIRHITHGVFFLTLNLIVGCKAADDASDTGDTGDTSDTSDTGDADADADEDGELCAEMGEQLAESEYGPYGAERLAEKCDEDRIMAVDADCLNEIDTSLEYWLESTADLVCDVDAGGYTPEVCLEEYFTWLECIKVMEMTTPLRNVLYHRYVQYLR